MRKKRRDKSLLLTHRIHTRISQEKYEELTAILNRSRGISTHSELLRYILNNQTIQMVVYDETYDRFLQELSKIRTQLRSIGININQVTRQFHGSLHENEKNSYIQDLLFYNKKSDQKVKELYSLITQLSKEWLLE